ncbi:hypothetical protein [Mycobacteroides abscessus]|nr:hypothetical protein [Mycobacteroides abscessus]SIA43729.1 Uncharacterised protein [Mycobacteroides abscessus subsp. abscessus]SIA55336.1 Uncharacterised protein [Mycobacteroides abscessus subsp. abscessus]
MDSMGYNFPAQEQHFDAVATIFKAIGDVGEEFVTEVHNYASYWDGAAKEDAQQAGRQIHQQLDNTVQAANQYVRKGRSGVEDMKVQEHQTQQSFAGGLL